ncbi:hypothetical protein [Atopomonas sediminilitoris]|uniref:hypothetical protein n=1 Tax=Atopomonas sediminilitoris TaxID=2919919 RepID=UPI001F4E5093|nr:hypothetical protein [Atopomonas sediminilitoris]MCJ8168336.1 hypothetical protein [Atopomonas sediminilitoris]
MSKITSDMVCSLFDFDFESGIFSVDGVGVTSSTSFPSMLSFLDNKKYLSELNSNEAIKVVFVRPEDVNCLRKDIICLQVEDPVWYFFTLLNYLAISKKREKTLVSGSAVIHSSAVISDVGVIIGDDVLIEPNVTILQDVEIMSGAIIRAGAVVGVDGYEHKRTSRGILTVAHDGKVIVSSESEIGVNSNIVKGFSYRDTIIGEQTKIDALVHYAHGVQCGSRCMIVACAMIGGHVTIGDDVWIGPNSTISNRVSIGDGAFVTLGSVVVQDVPAGQKVTGNFAIPHMTFIRNLKASAK